jgi:hypothetical protein
MVDELREAMRATAEVTPLRLTERQQKHVAKLIEKHTSWTIGWYVSEGTRAEMYANCAAAIAKYLNRPRRR